MGGEAAPPPGKSGEKKEREGSSLFNVGRKEGRKVLGKR